MEETFFKGNLHEIEVIKQEVSGKKDSRIVWFKGAIKFPFRVICSFLQDGDDVIEPGLYL
jgi:hypothetical protein